MMVPRFSAQLYLPFEIRLPIAKTHSDLVKFASRADPNYQTVINYLKGWLGTYFEHKFEVSYVT